MIEHTVYGSEETTYHDFTATESGNDLIISSGSYINAGNVLFETVQEVRVTMGEILWITKEGFKVDDANNPIDILSWRSSDGFHVIKMEHL